MDMHKIAGLARKSGKLIVEKVDDHNFYVTDTYFVIKVNDIEFGEFFSKYNSYKSTVNIPFSFEGAITLDPAGDKFIDAEINNKVILDGVKEAKETKITPFIKNMDDREARIFSIKGGELGIINRKYEVFLDEEFEYKAPDKFGPLFVIDEGVTRVVIMPIRQKVSIADELKGLIR